VSVHVGLSSSQQLYLIRASDTSAMRCKHEESTCQLFGERGWWFVLFLAR